MINPKAKMIWQTARNYFCKMILKWNWKMSLSLSCLMKAKRQSKKLKTLKKNKTKLLRRYLKINWIVLKTNS